MEHDSQASHEDLLQAAKTTSLSTRPSNFQGSCGPAASFYVYSCIFYVNVTATCSPGLEIYNWFAPWKSLEQLGLKMSASGSACGSLNALWEHLVHQAE